MAERIISRLQTPVDESGKRTDIHLITSSDAVIVDGENLTLTEKLETLGDGISITETKPFKACLWGQIIRKES